MYFVFRSEIRTWHNQLLRAKPSGETLLYADEVMPYWWDAKPVPIRPKEPLTLAINAKAPMLDNYLTAMGFDLYSVRLVKLIHDAGVRFETLPASLVDQRTVAILPVQYEVFHLLEKYPAIDEHQSDMGDPSRLDELASLHPEQDAERLDEVIEDALSVDRLVLNQRTVYSKRPMFRVEGHEELVLIHQDLKTVLDEAGITGCEYIPAD